MQNLLNPIKKLVVLSSILLILSSCSGFKLPKPGDARTMPVGGKERAKKNLEEGRGIGLKNLGGLGKTTYQFSTSNPMWRATFDVIDFMPLVTVDYSGGTIITDWYSDTGTSDSSLKFTIRFLSNELRADSLKIIVHKKTCGKESTNCVIKKISSKLENEIRSAIVKKAAVYSSNDKKKN